MAKNAIVVINEDNTNIFLTVDSDVRTIYKLMEEFPDIIYINNASNPDFYHELCELFVKYGAIK